ncbi:hypothetical protein Y032_0592g402 [Ancylostoma ceylanicum]|uniref:Uncharacterized protein n=1 Tax=Ancylostoma ceylanicum TaxID=53326 RepID=A0A016WMJ5_9BILA|nr:hypothetical protein Y032_0592g402 [Ancylostoma ceylanicum]
MKRTIIFCVLPLLISFGSAKAIIQSKHRPWRYARLQGVHDWLLKHTRVLLLKIPFLSSAGESRCMYVQKPRVLNGSRRRRIPMAMRWY